MKIRTLITSLWLAPTAAMAISPAPVTHVLRQADGTEIHAQLKGGPFLNWFEDEEGHLLVQKDGNWYFGKLRSSFLMAPQSGNPRGQMNDAPRRFEATDTLAGPGTLAPSDAVSHYHSTALPPAVREELSLEGGISTRELRKIPLPPPPIIKKRLESLDTASLADGTVSTQELRKIPLPPPPIIKKRIDGEVVEALADGTVSTQELRKIPLPPPPIIKKRIDGEVVEALADGTVSTQELRKIPLPPPPIIKKRIDGEVVEALADGTVSTQELRKIPLPPPPIIKKRIDGEAVEALADGTVSTQELRKIPLPPPPIIKKRLDSEVVEALADGTVSTQELRKIPLPPPPIIKKRFDSVEMQRSLASEPKVLDLPLLTVMVDFDDVATENDFSDLIWGQGKSLVNYFNSMSGGQLRLVPAADNDGDGIVKVHLNRNHPSCGSDCSYGINGVLAQALVQADDYLDFSQYDLNGDGTLTPDELAVQFIFAGNEAATSGNPKQSIWGHTWTMPAVSLDGTRLESYSALGEKQWGHRATLGVLAHQLGHLLLGLPDLYQDDPDHAGDIGQWGLMGTGSWNMTPQDHFMGDTPAALSAWSKSYLGLLTPKALVESGNYDVATGEVQKIYLDPYLRGQQQGDYLLLDVRDRSGYDSALPDQGLLVTQVSQSGAETVSTVQLLADDAVLPGSQQQRNLRLATAQGLPSDVYLSAISDPASQMRFSLNLDGGLKGALLGHYYQGQHQEVSGSLQWQGQAPQATSRLEGIDLYAPKAGSYSLKVQGGSDSRALSWHLQPGWHRLMLDQPLSIRAGFDLQLAGPALAVEPGTQAPAGQVLAGQGEAAQLSLLLGQEAPQTTDNQQSDSQSGAGFGRWLLQVLGG